MIAPAGFDSSFEITALSTVDIYSAAANGDNTGFVIASCTDIKLTTLIAKYFYSLMSLAGSPLAKNILPLL